MFVNLALKLTDGAASVSASFHRENSSMEVGLLREIIEQTGIRKTLDCSA